MNNLRANLEAGKTLLMDGAMGSLLMDRGLEPGESPETFTLDRPEILREISTLYLEAGADIIETNTFGATPLKLAAHGGKVSASEINVAAVRAAREAVGDRAHGAIIAGSCGPTGRILKPFGDTEAEEVLESYRVQAQALIDSGVDFLCVETMTDLREAVLAVKAIREVSAEIPVAVTMTFDPTPRGYFTIMGVDIPTAAAGLEEAGAEILGSNCGNGIENMLEIAREFRKHTTLPLLIQPNAGMPELQGLKTVYPETPEFFSEKAAEFLDYGVAVIGGCCGTTPDHIRALRAVLDSVSR